MDELVRKLVGPICVLGSTGFIGTNLLRYLKSRRSDVHGSGSQSLWYMLDDVRPKTVFNCIAYGAHSYQAAPSLIYHTNFTLTQHLIDYLSTKNFHTYVHAGSSAEYGVNKAFPIEESPLHPITAYGVSKAAASDLIYYYGKTHKKRVCNLRIYCAYGPHEKPNHIIPTVISYAVKKKKLPEFVRGDISRDFIYVEDVCRAFVAAAVNLREGNYGEAFNIGTGIKTTIEQVAELAGRSFGIEDKPKFTMSEREWDTSESWCAQTHKARTMLGWEHKISFEQGFGKTSDWYRSEMK